MRGIQTVEFVEWERYSIPRETKSVKIIPKGRFKWLQNIAFKFLQKSGAVNTFYENVNAYRTVHHVDANSFIRRVEEQKGNLLELFGIKASTLLIGSKDYFELMRSDELRPYHFSFDAGFEVRSPRGFETFVGLKVEVIPWMRGMVVMP